MITDVSVAFYRLSDENNVTEKTTSSVSEAFPGNQFDLSRNSKKILMRND